MEWEEIAISKNYVKASKIKTTHDYYVYVYCIYMLLAVASVSLTADVP